MSDDGHTLKGDIRRHADFPSALLGNRRDVLVYLPPGYSRSRLRYPVLYMHDGQNVFDAATSFAGVEWGVDDTAERLIPAGEMASIIIVAPSNAGADRIHEYTPTRGHYEIDGKPARSKGLGSRYGRFLIEELKPFIDRRYRTRREADFTGVAGSSLGGLMSLVLGLRFPGAFNRLAVMSPSVWWDERIIYQMVTTLKTKLPLKIWLDMGTAEADWENIRELRDRLVAKGWKLGEDLHYEEIEGAGHDEGAWAQRMDRVLKWLYPPMGNRRRATPL